LGLRQQRNSEAGRSANSTPHVTMGIITLILVVVMGVLVFLLPK
jgi:hypothetical protein